MNECRFLWDARNCDESKDGSSLVVSSAYSDHWSDLEELWFLGMQIFSSLLEPVSTSSRYLSGEKMSFKKCFPFDRSPGSASS